MHKTGHHTLKPSGSTFGTKEVREHGLARTHKHSGGRQTGISGTKVKWVTKTDTNPEE